MRSAKYYIIDNGKRVEINLDKEVAMNAYNDYVGRNIREFDLRVKFNGKELASSDIASIRINSDLFTSDSFTIGSVVAETLELTIYMDTVFGTDDFNYVDDWVIDKEKPIVPYVALKTEVEIETELGFVIREVWQEVNLGPFFINPDGVNEDGLGIMSIRASSLFTHTTYSNRTLEFLSNRDRTIIELIEKAEDAIKDDKVHFELLNTDIPNIQLKYDNIVDMSVREAINYAATLYGGYARTIYNESNDRVYLEFFRKEQTDYVYDESDYINLSRSGSGSGLNITKIKCKINDENTMLSGSYTINRDSIISGSGSDTNHTVFIECPDMTEEQLYAILLQFKGYSFRPTTTKIFGNPLLQVGDITTVKGRGINSSGTELPLHSVIYNITGSGITMDIKSLFKVTEAERQAQNTMGDDDSGNNDNNDSDNNFNDEDIQELYDRTTIQYANEDEDLPLITIKEDYLKAKETLTNHITNIGLHSGGGSGGNVHTGDVIIAGERELTLDEYGDYQGWYGKIEPVHCTYPENINNGTCGIYKDGPDNGVFVRGNCGLFLSCASPVSRPMLALFSTVNNLDLTEELGGVHHCRIQVDTLVSGTLTGYVVKVTAITGHDSMDKQFYARYALLDYCELSSNLYANGYTITNAKTANEVSSQSEYTANLINSGTNENIMHSNMSYDSGELRWCHKENVFTYPESDIDPETDQWVYTGRHICYVELPIFMAENIENDYHINICKKSWGDYRIIEQDPYYFILESQEDNFAFTFEVVAKLTDHCTLDNNAVIATNENYGMEADLEKTEDKMAREQELINDMYNLV
jgi:hypothetical protein